MTYILQENQILKDKSINMNLHCNERDQYICIPGKMSKCIYSTQPLSLYYGYWPEHLVTSTHKNKHFNSWKIISSAVFVQISTVEGKGHMDHCNVTRKQKLNPFKHTQLHCYEYSDIISVQKISSHALA